MYVGQADALGVGSRAVLDDQQPIDPQRLAQPLQTDAGLGIGGNHVGREQAVPRRDCGLLEIVTAGRRLRQAAHESQRDLRGHAQLQRVLHERGSLRVAVQELIGRENLDAVFFEGPLERLDALLVKRGREVAGAVLRQPVERAHRRVVRSLGLAHIRHVERDQSHPGRRGIELRQVGNGSFPFRVGPASLEDPDHLLQVGPGGDLLQRLGPDPGVGGRQRRDGEDQENKAALHGPMHGTSP